MKPAYTLIGALIASMVILLLVIFVTKGIAGIILLTCLGLFISILFPTLYALAIEGLGVDTAKASGILTMGFLGGTVIPFLQGRLADMFTIRFSFVIAVGGYLLVLLYILLVNKKNLIIWKQR